MADLDVILQPEAFRKPGQPAAWAFFVRLRLLLGWGDGLSERLGDQMTAIRTAFLLMGAESARVVSSDHVAHCRDALQPLLERLQEHDSVRPPMPFYARLVTRTHCYKLAANAVCEAYAGPRICPFKSCTHPLEANQEYRVRRRFDGSGRTWLVVEKRHKTLKPEHSAKMEALGLAHAHGTGKRSERKPSDEKRVRRQRNPQEQAFASYLAELKKDYCVLHVPQLMVDPSARPAHFLVQMAELQRKRHEAVACGKKDRNGQPYQPYTDEALLLDTCYGIAGSEATDLAFDYAWVPVLRFDHDGLTEL